VHGGVVDTFVEKQLAAFETAPPQPKI